MTSSWCIGPSFLWENNATTTGFTESLDHREVKNAQVLVL